jgi:hypothetical protein
MLTSTDGWDKDKLAVFPEWLCKTEQGGPAIDQRLDSGSESVTLAQLVL